jgi:hypothetical protein
MKHPNKKTNDILKQMLTIKIDNSLDSVGLDFYTYIYFQFQHKGQWNEMVL